MVFVSVAGPKEWEEQGAEEVVLDGALGEGGSVWAVGCVTKTWGCFSFSMDT